MASAGDLFLARQLPIAGSPGLAARRQMAIPSLEYNLTFGRLESLLVLSR
jgi:hypothetical protein